MTEHWEKKTFWHQVKVAFIFRPEWNVQILFALLATISTKIQSECCRCLSAIMSNWLLFSHCIAINIETFNICSDEKQVYAVMIVIQNQKDRPWNLQEMSNLLTLNHPGCKSKNKILCVRYIERLFFYLFLSSFWK